MGMGVQSNQESWKHLCVKMALSQHKNVISTKCYHFRGDKKFHSSNNASFFQLFENLYQ